MKNKNYIIMIFIISGILFLFSLSFTLTLVKGNSMNNTLKKGDLFLCNNMYYNISKGDIIVYSKPSIDHKIAHRVVKKLNSSAYRTKGDNNQRMDKFIVYDKDISCVKFIQKNKSTNQGIFNIQEMERM